MKTYEFKLTVTAPGESDCAQGHVLDGDAASLAEAAEELVFEHLRTRFDVAAHQLTVLCVRSAPRLDVKLDDAAEVATIEGVKYSYALFRGLGVGGLDLGTVVRVVSREDGQVTLQKVEEDAKTPPNAGSSPTATGT